VPRAATIPRSCRLVRPARTRQARMRVENALCARARYIFA
jgi:hypothetical protein